MVVYLGSLPCGGTPKRGYTYYTQGGHLTSSRSMFSQSSCTEVMVATGHLTPASVSEGTEDVRSVGIEDKFLRFLEGCCCDNKIHEMFGEYNIPNVLCTPSWKLGGLDVLEN